MRTTNLGLLRIIVGATTLSLLFACSSNDTGGLSSKSAKLTTDSVQYFVDHLSLTTNSFFADGIFSKAGEIVIDQLNQSASGTITLECGNEGTVTSNPNINSNGIGILNLTLEACKLGVPDEGEVGIGSSRQHTTDTLSGSVSVNIAGFNIDDSFGYITAATLSFNALSVEIAGRRATLDGTVVRKAPDENAETNNLQIDNNSDESATTVIHTDIYNVTGTNHQFSRNFQISNAKVVSGISFEGIQNLPALSIGSIKRTRDLTSGIVSDEVEGSTELIVGERRIQIINPEDGNVIGERPILELEGADGSRAMFSRHRTSSVTMDIDENGDGDFESEVTLPW